MSPACTWGYQKPSSSPSTYQAFVISLWNGAGTVSYTHLDVYKRQLLGHLVMGAQEVARTAEELGIPQEKSLLLQHMILSHHGEDVYKRQLG